MANIMLDVNGWQTVLNFETGEPVEDLNDLIMEDMMKITPALPYPGDTNPESVDWTVDVALAVSDYYNPDFIMLAFSTQQIIKINEQLTPEESVAINERIFKQVTRFLEKTDYEAMVIGMGGMQDIKGVIDQSKLSTGLTSTMCAYHYAGLFMSRENDADVIKNMEHIKYAITKDDFKAAHPEMKDAYYGMLPDYLLMSSDGYVFNEMGKRGIVHKKTPRMMHELPVYTTLERPNHILEVRGILERAMDEGKKVALIMLEGTGTEDFKFPYNMMGNQTEWFVHDQGLSQYLAVATGKPFYNYDYPPIVNSVNYLNTSEKYPYSQHFSVLPEDTIGRRPDKRTAAVGTRSGFIHETTMADICVECHSRQLSMSGVFVLVNDPKDV
ncbi:MAG: hypothetical protein CVU90_10430 [Firmicutes bacterium HGW-Firmicutes-15]|nr:MAG: hypothetical protein CVU90_10430 [Firmicutes bacterium HGW-Firmicutes-15]